MIEPFIGRRAQLKRLSQIFQPLGFRASAVLIEGEAGIGKTKLLEAFEKSSPHLDAIWAYCNPRSGIDPWIHLIHSLSKRRELSQEEFELYQSILSGQKTPERDSELSWRMISRLLFLCAASKPMLILLEDLHEARPDTLGCLKILLMEITLKDHPGLGIILTLRSKEDTQGNTFAKEMISKNCLKLLKVEPFKKREILVYLRRTLGGEIQKELLEEISKLSGGNPFFISTLLKNLLETQKIFKKGDFWQKRDQKPLEAPDQIRALLEERLKRTTFQAREILSALAVAARPLSEYMLGRLIKLEEDLLRNRLQELSEGGFIEKDRGFRGYNYHRLKHELLRQTIYQGLSQTKRKSLHKKILEELLELYKERIEEGIDQIATHAILCEERTKMRKYLPIAATYSEKTSTYEKALEYYKVYLQTLQEDEHDELYKVKVSMAELCSRLGKFKEVEELCEDILKDSSHLELPDKLRVVDIRGMNFINQGDPQRAMEYIRLVSSELRDLEKHPLSISFLYQHSLANILLGNYPKGERLAQKGIRLIKRFSKDIPPEATIKFENLIGVCLVSKGEFEEGRKHFLRLIKDWGGDPLKGSPLYGNLARITAYMGNYQEAEEYVNKASMMYQRCGSTQDIHKSKILKAYILNMRGEYSRAKEILVEVKKWTELSESAIPDFLASIEIGNLHYTLGDLLTARSLYQDALKYLTRMIPGESLIYYTKMMLGAITAQEGNWEDALKIFKETKKEFQEKTIDLLTLVRTSLNLAEVAINYGRSHLGEEFLSEIEKFFPRRFNALKPYYAHSLILKATLAREKGELDRSLNLLEEAISTLKDMNLPLLLAKAYYEVGRSCKIASKPEASLHFEDAKQILQRLLERVPPELSYFFRNLRIYRDLMEPPAYSQQRTLHKEILDQELLFLGRMEKMLGKLLEIDDPTTCRDLIFEDMLSLCTARKGVFFLRKEASTQGNVFLSVQFGDLKVDFVPALLRGFDQEGLSKLPKDLLREAIIKGEVFYRNPYLYGSLSLKGRTFGMLILEIPEGLGEILLETVRLYLRRAALVIDRISMVEDLKGRYKKAKLDMLFLEKEKGVAQTELELRFMELGIVARSETMRKIFQLVERLAHMDVPVLIQGETGVGKELMAKAVHLLGSRRDAPFLAINCAAIPESLLDSELFGYVKGAFTGAEADKAGLFESAGEGSIFLDEIEGMSEGMQRKLLRVIEDAHIRRIGGTSVIPVRARIIAATNRNIKEMVKEGKFREDLFYRLNVAVVEIPPLRERREDIPPLIMYILARISKEKGLKLRMEAGAIERLTNYSWPGNVRELENYLLRFAITQKELIRAEDIKFLEEKEPIPLERFFGKKFNQIEQELGKIQNDLKRNLLEKLLEEHNWDIPEVSRILDLPQSTLYRKLKKLGVRRR